MSTKTRMIAKMGGSASALALVAGLVIAAFAPISVAFAETPHIRATMDTDSCAACHRAHSATDDALLLGAHAANSTAGDVCIPCHAGGDTTASDVFGGSAANSFNGASGHVLESGTGAAAIGDCLTCHDAHEASSDERGIPARKVNGVAVTSSGKQLCLACHDADNSWYGAGYPSTANPTRDATGYPISGTWPGPATYASSTNAHRLIPESTQTVAGDSVPREQGDCRYCHASHGSGNAYDGLLTTYTVPRASTLASDQADGSYAALCFTCHGGRQPNGFSTTPVDIKQFSTASGTGGHSIVTSGGVLPVGAPLPCFECHNPHGSKRGNASMLSDELGASLGTTYAANVRSFCFTCHATSDTIAGWNSTDSTYTVVSSTDTVVGLPRNGAELVLLPTNGHAEGDTQSCYDCHGDSYAAGGKNVHDPGDGSTGGTPLLLTVLAPSLIDSSSVLATGSVDTSGAASATDTAPPLTISDVQTTYTAEATITLTAVDATGGVGVADTYYSLDGGEVTTGTVVTTSTAGDHVLKFWSVDLAGNVESPATVTFTIVGGQPPPIETVMAPLAAWIDPIGT